MLAFSRTLLCSSPRAFVRCICVTGSFHITVSLEDEALWPEGANQIPAKILEADEPIAFLARREQHAVKRDISPGCITRQFIYEIAEVLENSSLLRQLPMSRGELE